MPDGIAAGTEDRFPLQGDSARPGVDPDRARRRRRPLGNTRGKADQLVAETVAVVQGAHECLGDLVFAQGVGVQSVVAGMAAVPVATVVAGPVDQGHAGLSGTPRRDRFREHAVVLHGVAGQVLPAADERPLRNVGQGEIEVRFDGAGLVDQRPHTVQSAFRATDEPAHVVEPEPHQQQVGLVLRHLFGDQRLVLRRLPAPDREMVGVEVRRDPGGVPARGDGSTFSRSRGFPLQWRHGRCLGLLLRPGALVRADEIDVDVLLLEPFPQAVAPGPVTFIALGHGITHQHDLQRHLGLADTAGQPLQGLVQIRPHALEAVGHESEDIAHVPQLRREAPQALLNIRYEGGGARRSPFQQLAADATADGAPHRDGQGLLPHLGVTQRTLVEMGVHQLTDE